MTLIDMLLPVKTAVFWLRQILYSIKPFKKLFYYFLTFKTISLESNLRKERWLRWFKCIHKFSFQISQYFLDSILNIDHYCNCFEHNIVTGGFNLEPSHSLLAPLMNGYNYFNLIKANTCLKGPSSVLI